MFIGGAVESAKHAKAGFSGYALAIAIGLLLGVFNFWAITYKVNEAVDGLLERYSERVQQRCAGALFLAAALWILFAGVFAEWVTSAAIRLAF
jgi:hypothetical protein